MSEIIELIENEQNEETDLQINQNTNLDVDKNYVTSESSNDQIVPHPSPIIDFISIENKIDEYLRIWSELGGSINTDGPTFEDMLKIAKAQQKSHKLVRNSVCSKSTGSIHYKMPKIDEKYEEELKSKTSINSSMTEDLSSRVEQLINQFHNGSAGDCRKESPHPNICPSDNVAIADNNDKNSEIPSSPSVVSSLNEANKEILHMRTQLNMKNKELAELLPRYQFLEDHFEGFILMKADYLSLKNQQYRMKQAKNTEKISEVQVQVEVQPNTEFKLKQTVSQCEKSTQASGVGCSGIILRSKMSNNAELTSEMSTQTWETTVICSFCTKTRSLLENPRFQTMISSKQKNICCILDTEMVELQESFKVLKKSIQDREHIYENRKETAQILQLKSTNCDHRARIVALENQLNVSKSFATVLQKIIHKFPTNEINKLAKQEQHWVQVIQARSLKNPTVEPLQHEN